MNNDHGLIILSLHRVGLPPPMAKIRGLFISPRLLKLQVLMLRSMGYRFVTLNEALAYEGEKRAVITFDDGYADNFYNALPVLRRLNVPATLFPITGDIGHKDVVWDEAGEKLPSDMLDWTMIERLQSAGWEIGSHAERHVHLERYSESEQRQLISRSLDAIEERTGMRPTSFAYPYGSYNDNTKKILRELGITHAVTIKRSNPSGDMLELPRVPIGGRFFFHYFKNARRAGEAVGKAEVIRGVLVQAFTPVPPQPSSLPIFAADQ